MEMLIIKIAIIAKSYRATTALKQKSKNMLFVTALRKY